MKYISTENAPAAIGPYSQAIEVNGFIFASGQVPLCPKTGVVVGKDITEQATQTCENIKGLLTAAGVGFENVVKTTCFLAEMADFAAFNAVYAEYFVGKPALSCVAVKDLPRGVLCEIEILAVK
jgi:2-iminobutanoate/2-iminopropanoate deaminase